MANKIAVVRVRGGVKTRQDIKDTLNMLRLYNKNHCVVLEGTPQNIGMINKVKDYVTYGKISEEVFKELLDKRKEEYTSRDKDSNGKLEYKRKYIEIDGKKYNKYFRLCPPRKGYGGIKTPFLNGGALGNRKDKINDLIKRMI